MFAPVPSQKGETVRNTSMALVGIALLGLAACGGDSAGGSGATKGRAVSKPTYAAQADAICAKADKRETAIGSYGFGLTDLSAFNDVDYLTRFNAPGRAALRALRALEPPKAQRRAAATMLAGIQAMVGAIDGRIHDLETGKGNASDRARAFQDGAGEVAPSAAVLGLSHCQGVSL